MFGIPLGDLAILALAIIGGGIVTGLLAGIFGVGGGAVIVPVLYEVFRVLDVPEDVRMQLCVGTSLAIIVPTSLRSFLSHRARGQLPAGVLRRWFAPVAAGILLGAAIAGFAPGWVFKAIFAIMAFAVALRMFFARESWSFGDTLPREPLMGFYGFVIGLYSAFMGVGGGAVSTLILTLYRTPIHAAVGVSAGVGVVISIIGTLGYIAAGWSYRDSLPPLSIGFVSLTGLVLMAPITTALAPLGARISHSLSKRQLEIAFGIFLTLVSLRFALSLLL